MSNPADPALVDVARRLGDGLNAASYDWQLFLYKLFCRTPELTTQVHARIQHYIAYFRDTLDDIRHAIFPRRRFYDPISVPLNPVGPSSAQFSHVFVRLVHVDKSELTKIAEKLHKEHSSVGGHVYFDYPDVITSASKVTDNEAQTAEQYMKFVVLPSLYSFNRLLERNRHAGGRIVEPRGQAVNTLRHGPTGGRRQHGGRFDHAITLVDPRNPTEGTNVAFIEEKKWGSLSLCGWNSACDWTREKPKMCSTMSFCGDVDVLLPQIIKYVQASNATNCIATDCKDPAFMQWTKKQFQGTTNALEYYECRYWTRRDAAACQLSDIGSLLYLMQCGTDVALRSKP